MSLEMVLDFLEVALDSFYLDQWRVRKLRKKSKTFINSSKSAIVFSNFILEDLFLFLSN